MSKNRSKLDWEFLEDQEAPWPPAESDHPVRSRLTARQRMRRIIVFAITMVALLTAGIGTIYARNEAQKGIADVEEGVQAAVDVEQWVQAHEPELSVELLIDDDASRYVQWMSDQEQRLLSAVARQESPAHRIEVVDTRFAGQYAATEIRLSLPNANEETQTPLRQTRFYRETPQGWLRTEPVPALWGQPRSLETQHLVWRYRQRDANVVLGIADQMDALYARMLADYGIAHRFGDDKLVVEIQVAQPPGIAMFQSWPATVIVVPSPAVYLVPHRYSDADVLAQSVALAMLQSLWTRANVQHGFGTTDAVLAGLRLWELGNMGLSLSAATWNALVHASGAKEMHDVCVAYAVWMLPPVAAGLPFHCKGERAEALTSGLDQVGARSLPSARRSHGYLGFSDDTLSSIGSAVLMSAVIDYAVAQYGRETLPELVSSVTEHDSWQTLAPAVFGVPFDEFEQGWRRYLSEMAE